MTSVAQQLRPFRERLDEARETHGRRSGHAQRAFEALFRESVRLGQPLDSLRKYARDEDERFFANTIP